MNGCKQLSSPLFEKLTKLIIEMYIIIFILFIILIKYLLIFQLPHSVNKGLSMLHTSGIVAKAHTAIVQLDCVGEKLLVSTMTKSAIVDLKRFVSILFSSSA